MFTCGNKELSISVLDEKSGYLADVDDDKKISIDSEEKKESVIDGKISSIDKQCVKIGRQCDPIQLDDVRLFPRYEDRRFDQPIPMQVGHELDEWVLNHLCISSYDKQHLVRLLELSKQKSKKVGHKTNKKLKKKLSKKRTARRGVKSHNSNDDQQLQTSTT
jgi:hypothetical protein